MSKKYIVTVNGTSYEVVVEDAVPGQQYTPAAQPAEPKKEAPAAPAAAAPTATAAPAAGNGTPINAPLPGLVLKVVVSAGQSVKKGDLLCVLEAMKMENDILAPVDGTIESVVARQGSNVNSGELLLTIKA